MKHDRASLSRLKRLGGAAVLVVALALEVPTQADPFYLRYDADQFPEDVGWERRTTDPYKLLVRQLNGGVLTIDSRASPEISDFYRMNLADFSPGVGELAEISWRLRVPEATSSDYEVDPNVLISNGSAAYVQVDVGVGFVAVNEDGLIGPEHLYDLEPGQWHTFVLRSADLCSYELRVDGAAAFTGSFTRQYIGGPNRISFGDKIIGLTSLSEWDFIEVRVTPEPGPGELFALTGLVGFLLARRRS